MTEEIEKDVLTFFDVEGMTFIRGEVDDYHNAMYFQDIQLPTMPNATRAVEIFKGKDIPSALLDCLSKKDVETLIATFVKSLSVRIEHNLLGTKTDDPKSYRTILIVAGPNSSIVDQDSKEYHDRLAFSTRQIVYATHYMVDKRPEEEYIALGLMINGKYHKFCIEGTNGKAASILDKILYTKDRIVTLTI